MADETQVREDLKNLLRFSEELLATNDKVVFNIADYHIHLTERDFLGKDGAPLPGINFGLTEDTWLSFARLRESKPPLAPPELAPWLRAEARPVPERPPVLLSERVVDVSADEASELVDAGLTAMEQVAQLDIKPGNQERWAVPLRSAELPDVNAALESYVSGPWQVWAAEEAPRRQAMRVYETLYKAQAQIAAATGEGGQELVIGIGLVRWSRPPYHLNVPIIEQRAEFELDESNGTLAILPRNVSPLPALRPFMEMSIGGAAALQREMTTRLEAIAKDPDVAFGPFQPGSFLPVLETCAARLDASGTVLPPEEHLKEATEALRISPTFCVIVRTRRDDILRDDIRRLSEAVTRDEADLPETARRFVVAPPDEVVTNIGSVEMPSLGIGNSSWNAESPSEPQQPMKRPGEWLFFPLPANEEQEEIARRLEQNDVYGVVVQGPPGTGKTHTIANIIGHFMAKGRRVLVSAHTADALAAIRDKLPDTLRNLTIAVTHSDREGARQLEEAVSALATRVQNINARATKTQAEDLLRAIQRDDERLAAIDVELKSVAHANLTEVCWRGDKALPQAIAAWCAEQGGRHAWFTDRLDLMPAHEPKFGDRDVAEARLLRAQLGPDIVYKPDDIPAGAASLPSLGAVVAAHRLRRQTEMRRQGETNGDLPRPDLSATSPGELAELVDWLERLASWRDACGHHTWMHRAWWAMLEGRQLGRLSEETLRASLDEAFRLAEKHDALALMALELAEIEEADRLGAALANLANGRSPFGFFSGLGKNPVKQAIDSARIAAAPPRQPADWQKLAELHTLRKELPGFVSRWNALAAQHGLQRIAIDSPDAKEAFLGFGRAAGEMLVLVNEAQFCIQRLSSIFPYGLEARKLVIQVDVSRAVLALKANIGEADISQAERTLDELQLAARRVGGPLGEALLQMADGLGMPDASEALVAERWREIQKETERLAALRDSLHRLHVIANLVESSGAKIWARRILSEPGDTVLPSEWADAWDWSRATGFIGRVANRQHVEHLTAEQMELVKLRERRFLEVIELMTFLGLHSRLTQNVLAALQQFLSALARLPKTAGAKTAVRQRRILRDSLQRCAKAVPCWIMPELRVAEQLPPDLGSFDLVVIDEASQSNIMALPVVLRGKKILIVGDDKQVSPSDVGVPVNTVNRLRMTYLHGQPLADQIDPATSLYELGGMMYPGRVVVLREHFRCVEPIIRFSSRFYADHLVPLRLPKPSERIDPPLLDILVAGGQRRGDVNVAEADAIIAEIQNIIADPVLNAAGPRSIGVISLHADKQAKLIYDKLMQDIGPEVMDSHKITCGDAATLQGQERDIVFLSMVHDQKTASKQSSRLYEQRYNVALPRARDRMVLVRSVTASDLKEGDIKLEVLRHFQNPAEGGRIGANEDVLAICQSEFERQVGKRLIGAGYRLRAQVPAGGYFIDFVVEGADDRRLAIELDGDSFHGPDRWAADVKRQKALERVGWTFWRCWASEWEADRDGVFANLMRVLGQHGIDPIGPVSLSTTALVEFRTVGSPTPGPQTNRKGQAPVEPSTGTNMVSAISPKETEGETNTVEGTQRQALPLLDRQVAVGDTVQVRFADGQARTLTVHIVGDGSTDGRERIAPNSPLGSAIMGLRTEEETEVLIDGKPRTIIVEAILDAA
jgi:very-short-patch-repair endonuclease